MTARDVHLIGSSGMFEGVRAVLRPGDRVVVGRSRHVELSAVRTPLALRVGREKLERNSSFRRLSRRHIELDFADGENLVLKNLSKNGFMLDGNRVTTAVLSLDAMEAGPHVVRFGTNEEIRIELGVADGGGS